MKYLNKQYLPLWVVFFSIALVFQNCTQVRYASIAKRDVLQTSNNGGSYEGKLEGQYYRFVPGYTCEQKQAPLAFITIFNTSITLTYNTPLKCTESVLDLNSDSVEGSVFQKEIIGYIEGIYEMKKTPPVATPSRIVEFWCRDRQDLDGIEVITYHDSLADSSATTVHYATSNGDGTYTQRTIPEFPVDSVNSQVFSKQSIFNNQVGFQLIVHFNMESPTQPGLFYSQLEVMIDGQRISRDALCRAGGRYDPH